MSLIDLVILGFAGVLLLVVAVVAVVAIMERPRDYSGRLDAILEDVAKRKDNCP